MSKIRIKPDDKPLKDYYKNLKDLREVQNIQHEGGTRRAFGTLLSDIAKKQKWTLVEEVSIQSSNSNRWIRPDGTLRDQWQLPHAWWEAKDSHDDLDFEIEKKRASGYPVDNTIFEDTQTAILYQNGYEILRCPVQNRKCFAQLLTEFLNYEIKPFEEFEQAITRYGEEIPNIAMALKQKIESAHQHNRAFQAKFNVFMALCRQSLNPNISREAVNEMLIQHLMTERVIRRVFNVERFTRSNVIAAEIEKVIDALTSTHFNRQEFLGGLDRFYRAIENAADHLADFPAKQHFINTVYERFFQGYSVKVADTHGIVYTPQPIVDFMCAAIEEALADEFGRKLGDEGVTLLDPATGTGNFVVNLLRRASESNPRHFEDFYRQRLFANEVMLMPYYIASLNIEHQYFELTGKAEAFPGLCFVDTLDLAHTRQLTYLTEANAERVKRQKAADINVIIGNPPYNVGQINENDNNKNRKYAVIEKRIRATYAKDSKATNKNQLYDAYVKFFRWAVDRLGGRDGIVCYVSNNSFVDAYAFDGFRRHLLQDFNRVYHLDLHGNVRKNPKLSGTAHNVFGIQVGVGITIAIRSGKYKDRKLFYHRVPELWRKEEKLAFLSEGVSADGALKNVNWTGLKPNRKHTWLVSETEAEFESHLTIGSKEAKRALPHKAQTIFKTYSNGAQTSRDAWVYDYEYDPLVKRMRQFVEDYNSQVDSYRRQSPKPNVDDFVDYDKIAWSSTLKQNLKRERYAKHNPDKIRVSLYRPFTKKLLYYAKLLIHRPGQFTEYFPDQQSQAENRLICVSGIGSNKPFQSYIVKAIPCLDILEKTQCFPFYTYDKDGSHRQENITDWALAQFRDHYQDKAISKWDIFYYVYALLHHPRYRSRYAADLKRQLPHIPFAPDFRAFAQAGRQLARLHLNYETAAAYELDWQVTKTPVSYRVNKMLPQRKRAAQAGSYKVYDTLKYNDSLTLRGIPERAFAYRLGNRSALDWIVDQYRVKTDSRSGITSDPNGYSHDEKYILKLIERVIWVSLSTVERVEHLEKLPFRDDDASPP